MARAQGRSKEDDVWPKIVHARSSALFTRDLAYHIKARRVPSSRVTHALILIAAISNPSEIAISPL